MNIWILVAGDPRISALVDTARGIEGRVTAAVVGTADEVARVSASGVDEVVWLGDPDSAPAEAMADAVASAVRTAAPDVVLGASRDAERVLLGAAAAALRAPVLTMVRSIEPVDGGVQVDQLTYGGIAERTLKVAGPVVAVMDGGAEQAARASAPVTEDRSVAPGHLQIIETTPAETSDQDLSAARRVVAVGRGLKSEADLALIQQLADALGAQVACSRPVAEALGWLPTDRYIGITGAHIAPELYVAVGISGQLQHAIGARSAKTIVVINSDADAPYFAEADYGLVGDLYAVVPALTEALS